MSRLSTAFARAEAEGRAALVAYVCAGDPNLAATTQLLSAVADAGADIIELGVPFSDPTADGPVIQRASERALRAGTTLPDVLGAVRALRQRSEVGVMLFGYVNPFLRYGLERLARDAREAGVDGLLVVDLPPEEAQACVAALRANQLDLVPLVAPTTPAERLSLIRDAASAFIYYVSLTGVTGADTDLGQAARRAQALRSELGLPVAVGFGIKTPADARTVAARADGLVVGSALVALIEQASDTGLAAQRVGELVRELREACLRS